MHESARYRDYIAVLNEHIDYLRKQIRILKDRRRMAFVRYDNAIKRERKGRGTGRGFVAMKDEPEKS